MTTNLLLSFGNKALRAAQAGFTMIELLVVIAVIGVLAVAVLSSINPIEQINKGRDTRARSDGAQLINAVDRYFSIAEEYPWNTDNPNANPAYTAATAAYDDEFTFDELGVDSAYDDWGWLQILVDNSEVKQGFTNRLINDPRVNYFISKDATANATMHVCFNPSSNAIQSEAQGVCAGTNDWPAEACDANCATDKTECLYCLP